MIFFVNFATVAVKFTSLNSKIVKYGSDFTNFEKIAKIYCCKMETVDFFSRKIRQICQNVPKTTTSKLKVP